MESAMPKFSKNKMLTMSDVARVFRFASPVAVQNSLCRGAFPVLPRFGGQYGAGKNLLWSPGDVKKALAGEKLPREVDPAFFRPKRKGGAK